MTKICPKCKIEHEKSGTFCSRSCANSRVFTEETNLKRAESNRNYMIQMSINRVKDTKVKFRVCKKCEKKFPQTTGSKICASCNTRLSGKFPTKVIEFKQKESQLERTIRLVESGELLHQMEVSIRRHMRRYLLHKNGNICSICNTSEWFGNKIPLVCDHIDGDSTNSNITNFRLICCNCDALLDTYKSKNRGKGRQYDREYRKTKARSSNLVG